MGGENVPLSEEEQRILQDIERSFYENDPDFARVVTSNGLSRSSRNMKLAVFGFVVSLVLLLMTFARIPALGLVGFLGMVTFAAMFLQNLRRYLRPRLQEVDKAAIDQLTGRLRERFRKN